MVAKITLRNSIDAWVSAERTSRFGDNRLFVHSAANAYFNFARPRFPAGTVITSAKFRVQPDGGSAGGAATVLLHTLTSSFDPGSLRWTALPTVGAQVASLARSSWYSSGAIMEFDVSSEVQRIVDGGDWFGWRLSTTKADPTQFVYSGQSTFPVELTIEYTAPPETPVDLFPRNNQAVNDPKPTLSWTTPGGSNSTQIAVQIQVSSSADFTTGVYTMNETASGASSFDLDNAVPAFTALSTGQSRYWRVRIKNDMGVWSPYSQIAQFKYQTPFSLTITSPTAGPQTDPTPTVSWTYGGAQAAWQVIVVEQDFLGVPRTVYDTGIQNTAITTLDLPEGVVSYTGRTYTAYVRVWEQGDLASVTGAPNYREASRSWTWSPSGATPPVEILLEPWLAQRPGRTVRWRYTGAAADRFMVTRTRAGKTSVFYVNATAAREGATEWYRYTDFPEGRADITYQVITIMANGTTSTTAASPTVSARVDYKMPFVVSTVDGYNRHFPILNASITPGLSEVSDVVVPIVGAPYLAQWALQKFRGHAEGVMTGDALPGIMTSDQMKDNFLWIRQNPRVVFFFQNEAVTCFVYNMDYSPVGRPDGGTDYAISFDFLQE